MYLRSIEANSMSEELPRVGVVAGFVGYTNSGSNTILASYRSKAIQCSCAVVLPVSQEILRKLRNSDAIGKRWDIEVAISSLDGDRNSNVGADLGFSEAQDNCHDKNRELKHDCKLRKRISDTDNERKDGLYQW